MTAFWKKLKDDNDPPTTAAPSTGLQLTTEEPPGDQRRPAFAPKVMKATSAEHLFETPALIRLFTCGLILIHNKRPAADRLVALATTALANVVQFKHVHVASPKAHNLLPDSRVRTSTTRRRRVFVVNTDHATEDIASVVDRYSAVRPRRGLWVRGDINELRPATIRQFDLLFLFDMPAEHLDRIRPIIPIAPDAKKSLGDSVNAGRATESVLVVLTADAIGSYSLPRLSPNSTIVPLYRDDRGTMHYPIS